MSLQSVESQAAGLLSQVKAVLSERVGQVLLGVAFLAGIVVRSIL